MFCPACGADDAYQGLMGVSCKNANCKFHKGTTPKPTPSSSPAAISNFKINLQAHQTLAVKSKATQKEIDEEKSKALEVLKEVEDVTGISNSAILAGGAPRDWTIGLASNDFDFFFLESDRKYFDQIAANLGITLDEKLSSGTYAFQALDSVYEGFYKNKRLQFISLSLTWLNTKRIFSQEEFVYKTFDFDICKCIYKSSNKIYTHAANGDLNFDTLTCSISDMEKYDRLKTLSRRSKKLQSYFPNHKIVINP